MIGERAGRGRSQRVSLSRELHTNVTVSGSGPDVATHERTVLCVRCAISTQPVDAAPSCAQAHGHALPLGPSDSRLGTHVVMKRKFTTCRPMTTRCTLATTLLEHTINIYRMCRYHPVPRRTTRPRPRRPRSATRAAVTAAVTAATATATEVALTMAATAVERERGTTAARQQSAQALAQQASNQRTRTRPPTHTLASRSRRTAPLCNHAAAAATAAQPPRSSHAADARQHSVDGVDGLALHCEGGGDRGGYGGGDSGAACVGEGGGGDCGGARARTTAARQLAQQASYRPAASAHAPASAAAVSAHTRAHPPTHSRRAPPRSPAVQPRSPAEQPRSRRAAATQPPRSRRAAAAATAPCSRQR